MKRKFELAGIENTSDDSTKRFKNHYKANVNWMDDKSIDPDAILREMYSTYYTKGELDCDKLKADIIITSKQFKNKSYELFKCLFKMPFRAINACNTSDLEHLVTEFGKKIVAHGVEEAKGGMYNLLLMCVSNQIKVSSVFWGHLINGPANISPLCHGPYYLIYAMPSLHASRKAPTNAKFTDLARILVPFPENKDILLDKLEEMVKMGLISDEMKQDFTDKLVTYNELLSELRLHAEMQPAPVPNAHAFYKPNCSNASPIFEEERVEKSGLDVR